MKNQQSEIERVLLSEEQIAARIKEVAKKMDEDYQGKEPIAICILKGSVVFFTDLIRAMKTPVSVEFMKVSSYGAGTTSSGKLSVSLDIMSNIQGKDVLIVEDIIDTGLTCDKPFRKCAKIVGDIIDSGHTMYALKQMLQTRNPASLRIVTLLDKPARRVADISADYTCFEIEDEFVIGYGLDYAERYRDLPYVGILSRWVYEN